jgi:hypothetical protein
MRQERELELKADCYIMDVRYYYKENLLWEIIEKTTAVGPQYLPWRIDTEKKGCARHGLFESKGF